MADLYDENGYLTFKVEEPELAGQNFEDIAAQLMREAPSTDYVVSSSNFDQLLIQREKEETQRKIQQQNDFLTFQRVYSAINDEKRAELMKTVSKFDEINEAREVVKEMEGVIAAIQKEME
ncbi:Hypothetical_protein [Hexamita inflata]|uniref:Hypothetical_protein n=1 Tax=Hexamita inflata TaxID=28002 RepID=A0ABP1HFL5_9EUKA